jgi:xylulokinase
MGVILSAASALSWWKNIANINTEKDLIDVAKKYNSDYMPIFLPYLSGERTPHNDPFAKSSFIGMTHATGSSELAQAVLEGISYAIVDCEHAISATGVSITDVSVIGGGSKSLYWGGIISSLLNRNLMYHNESSVGPAFGAARLALYEDCSYTLEQVFQRPIVSNIITPERSLSLELNNRLNIYRDTYQQLSKVFKKIGV